MRRPLAIIALIFGLAATGLRAASNGDIIRDVFYGFSNGEQRLIKTMTSDSATAGEFQSGLQRILNAKSDPAQFEIEKKRFRLQWRGKVAGFASAYASEDQAVHGKMGKIAKPSREAFGKAAPWMEAIDKELYSGGLYDGVIGKMNPYEAAYSIAGLQGLSKEKVAETEKKLRDNSSYPTRLVAGFILDDTRKKFQGDLADVQAAYQTDKKTVLAQLKGIDASLKLAKNKVSVEDSKTVGAEFDGSKKTKESGAVVVDSEPKGIAPIPDAVVVDDNEGKGKIGPKEGTLVASNKAAGALKKLPPEPPSPVTASLSALEIPPPKTDDKAFASRKGSSGAGIGTIIKEAFKKPAVALGAGAILGGLLGFLVGGPIGAAIGAALGAAAGGVLSKKLQD